MWMVEWISFDKEFYQSSKIKNVLQFNLENGAANFKVNLKFKMQKFKKKCNPYPALSGFLLQNHLRCTL
jgi:hypothetical protein